MAFSKNRENLTTTDLYFPLMLWTYRRLTNRFCCGKCFFSRLGGGGCTRTFLKFWLSRREITGKTLSVRKNIIGNINLGQFRPNVDKFGISNEIPDCRSAPGGGEGTSVWGHTRTCRLSGSTF